MRATNKNLTEKIRTLCRPLAASLGLEIWGVEVQVASRSLLRIYVEKAADSASHDSSALEPEAASDQAGVGRASPFEGKANNESLEAGGFAEAESLTESQDLDEQDIESFESDAEASINIDQCAKLSRMLGLSLEVEDFFEGAYVLEVSSPGLERIFFKSEQLYSAVGKEIEATLYNPLPEFPRRRKFAGLLKSMDGDRVIIALDVPEGGVAEIVWSDIKKVHQVYNPPEKLLPGKGSKNKKAEKPEKK